MSIVSVFAALAGVWLLVSALALLGLMALYAAERGGWRADGKTTPREPAAPASLAAVAEQPASGSSGSPAVRTDANQAA